jgi:hypothetical protein
MILLILLKGSVLLDPHDVRPPLPDHRLRFDFLALVLLLLVVVVPGLRRRPGTDVLQGRPPRDRDGRVGHRGRCVVLGKARMNGGKTKLAVNGVLSDPLIFKGWGPHAVPVPPLAQASPTHRPLVFFFFFFAAIFLFKKWALPMAMSHLRTTLKFLL